MGIFEENDAQIGIPSRLGGHDHGLCDLFLMQSALIPS
jgi:hypothetical protein